MQAVETEPYYEFLENDRGEIMLTLAARDDDPAEAAMLFDGKDTAVLFRRKGVGVKLTGMPEGVIPALESAETMLVCEMEEDGAFRHVYNASVKKVKWIP